MINRNREDPIMYWGKSMEGGSVDSGLFYNFINDYINDKRILENRALLYNEFQNLENFVAHAFKTVHNGGGVNEIMEMRNSNRENDIPLEKAKEIVKDIKIILKGGGNKDKSLYERAIDNLMKHKVILENRSELLSGSLEDTRKKLQTGKYPGFVNSMLVAIKGLPVIKDIFNIILSSYLLLENSRVDATILFLKILKVPDDIQKMFMTKEEEPIDEEAEWAYLDNQRDKKYIQYLIELLELDGSKPLPHVLNLVVKIIPNEDGEYRKYLFDPKTNAIFAYANFTAGDVGTDAAILNKKRDEMDEKIEEFYEKEKKWKILNDEGQPEEPEELCDYNINCPVMYRISGNSLLVRHAQQSASRKFFKQYKRFLIDKPSLFDV